MDQAPETVEVPCGSSRSIEALTVQAVVDLLDTLDAADVRATIGDLEQTLALLKPAAGARDALALVEPAVLREALQLRQHRGTQHGDAS